MKIKFFPTKMHSRLKAFSLVELLLGLSIASIIALSVYSTFSAGILLNARSRQQNELFRDARWSLRLIAKELNNAVRYDFTNSYPNKFSFNGSKHELSFVLGSDDGLKVIRYFLIPPEESVIHKILIGNTTSKNVTVVSQSQEYQRVQYLIREEKLFIDFLADDNTDTADQEIISMHVKENGLRFFYNDIENETGGPSDTSQFSSNSIPAHVRLEIDFLPATANSNPLTLTRDIYIPHGLLKEEG